ncbi:MAG: GtrA family protein [Nitrososphaerales archaeon]
MRSKAINAIPSLHAVMSLRKLVERYSELFRAAKFGIAGAVGFLVAEVILTAGIFAVYHNLNVNSAAYSSPTLLGLNVLAFGVGVTVSFFINERITVRVKSAETIIRLLKFQLVYVAGNAVTIGVQLFLLKAFSLTPSLGNIMGAIIAFPLSYFISMRYVWKVTSEKA